MGSIPGSGRSPGVANGNPLQYSCLGNFMDRGAWKATVHGGHKKLDMTKQTDRPINKSNETKTKITPNLVASFPWALPSQLSLTL